MKRIRRVTLGTQLLALTLSLCMARFSFGAPGDVLDLPEPVLGDAPGATRPIADGDATVSTQTGAFQYRYPIVVPPGRQGLEPSLSLSYSSQGALYGGLAAGWTLDLPEIRRDTSVGVLDQGGSEAPGGFPPFVSTMAGGHRLVHVAEPNVFSDAIAFRAEYDSTYTRYERSVSQPWEWRARTTDGLTYHFGDFDHVEGGLTDVWRARLTRMADGFGNTVHFYWKAEWRGGELLDTILDRIEYTANDGAGLEPFARVHFAYAPIEMCAGSEVPIGALLSFRDGWRRVLGPRRLVSIRTEARRGVDGFGNASGFREVRQYDLGYSPTATQCDALHGPMRMLTSIEETGYAPDGATATTLPRTTFSYGAFEPGLDTTKQFEFNFPPEHPASLAWGERNGGPIWPAINSMLIDMDGDGLKDRLYMTDAAACRARWQRNTGRGFESWLVSPTIQLPTMPWKNGVSAGFEEHCTLTGQYSLRENLSGSPECQAGSQGTYLAYRFVDLDGDGKVELLAALHHDWRWYDPEEDEAAFQGSFGNGFEWPSCEPSYGSCPMLDPREVVATEQCETVGHGQRCSFDEAELAEVIESSGTCPCQVMERGMNPRGNAWGTLNWEYLDGLEPPSIDPCSVAFAPHERCGKYVWMVFDHHRPGEFSQTPRTVLSPIPLESESADSGIGSSRHGFASSAHALVDIDGDSCLDAIMHSNVYPEVPASHWYVFRGDCKGHFRGAYWSSKHGTEIPYAWRVPNHAPPSLTELDAYPLQGVDANRWTGAISSMSDVNADGLPDMLYRDRISGRPHIYYNNGRGFESGSADNPASGGVALSTDFSHTARTFVDIAATSGGWITDAESRARVRVVDFDGDGRADFFRQAEDFLGNANGQPATLHLNAGDRPLEGEPFGAFASSLARRVNVYGNSAFAGGEWQVTSDYLDLDGDGVAEQVSFGPNGPQVIGDDFADKPMRLMNKIVDRVRGETRVRYASSTATDVVHQDPNAGAALPRNTWVVDSVTYVDYHADPAIIAGEKETTSYEYERPVWNTDPRGKWGFRGFETVEVESPSESLTIEQYGYDTDWSGRRVETVIYEDADDQTHPHTISTTDWTEHSLFGGTVTAFHPDRTEKRTCGAGQSEAACRASGALLRTESTWQALWPNRPHYTMTAVLRAESRVVTSSGQALQEGDRKSEATYYVYHDATLYRLRPATERRSAWIGDTATFADAGRTDHAYDAKGRVELTTRAWAHGAASAAATTRRTYDMATGNLLTVTKPEQEANGGSRTSYAYGAQRLYVDETTNELGHVIESQYDRGTGVLLVTRGPNRKACASSCSDAEETRTVIDGFGRPVEVWVTTDADSNSGGYQLELVGRTTYVDDAYPPRVLEERRMDYGGDEWVSVEKSFDGHGRLLREETETGLAHPAVSLYAYDEAGNLGALEVPDPSANDATRATYTFEYDRLGRQVAMSRPDGNGLVTSYDGLVTRRAECVTDGTVCVPADASWYPVALGPAAAKELRSDVFGHLVEVRELLDDHSWASTTYEYDANDNLARAVNPDGIETVLEHDWLSRRTGIRRGSRIWAYAYDRNGNLIAETAPLPAGANTANYITSIAYDDLDRVTSRLPASLGRSNSEQARLGIGLIQHSYDAGENGIGRLSIAHLGAFGVVAYSYDAQGRVVEETRDFDLESGVDAPYEDARTIRREHNALGAVTEVKHADSQTSPTTTYVEYDARGLPRSVHWLQPKEGNTYGDVRLVEARRNPAGRAIRHDGPVLDRSFKYDRIGRVIRDSGRVRKRTTFRQRFDYYGADEVRALVTRIGRTRRSMEFDYDSRHQLLAASDNRAYDAQFTYSPAGRVQTAFVDAQNAHLAQSRDVEYDYAPSVDPEAVGELIDRNSGQVNTSYAYDLAGNAIARKQGAKAYGFAYDGDDQQRRVNNPDGSTETYFYDHTGQRMLALTRAPGGTASRLRFWCGETEIWYGATGAQEKAWVHVGLGTPIARIEDRTSVEYTSHSMLGHLLASVRSNGTLAVAYTYGPFGEVLDAIGSTEDHLRRFNGKEYDATSGLSYYGVRYYDTLSLSWTQADPLYRVAPDLAFDEPRRMNLYVFSLNNPLRYADPDGRKPEGAEMMPGQVWSSVSTHMRAKGLGHTAAAAAARPEQEAARSGLRGSATVGAALVGAMFAGAICEGVGAGLLTWGVANPETALTATVATAEVASGADMPGGLPPGGARTGKQATRAIAATPGLPSLRQQYVKEVAELANEAASMRRAGMGSEQIAKILHAKRRALGVKYKEQTPSALLEEIYARNRGKYNDELGPSIEHLRERGKTWDQIIGSASRTGGKDLRF